MKNFCRGLTAAAFAALFGLPALAADPVTIHFWVAWDPQQADAIAAKKEIDAYEQSHPGVKIDVQNITYDALHNKVLTALSGGDAPDLSWGVPEWLGELNKMGALRDLSEEAKAWPDRGAIYPNVIDALTIDGHLLAMPHYLGIRALLVHQDLLKAAGITEPPKTWDELISVAQTIKQKTGKFGFGIAGTGVRSPQELMMYLAQNGLTIADRQPDGKYRNTWAEDKDKLAKATEVFAFYKSLLDQGAINPDGASWGYEEEDTNFSWTICDGDRRGMDGFARTAKPRDHERCGDRRAPVQSPSRNFFRDQSVLRLQGREAPQGDLGFCRLHERQGVPASCSPEQLAALRRDERQQVGKGFHHSGADWRGLPARAARRDHA
jgi:Bacterial extracellular solute-binding protein